MPSVSGHRLGLSLPRRFICDLMRASRNARGGTARNLIAPLAVAINTGVIREDGTVDVALHFDHRVFDGLPASRALEEMEASLRGEIVSELAALAQSAPVSVG
jgi:hypothetical protein